MWTVPSNRKRAIISILLMFFQQMTGKSPATTPHFVEKLLTPLRYQCYQLLRP
jgi:hypothetical protein